MTHRLINANRECQGTKQINSPDGRREGSLERDTDRLTASRGMQGWRHTASVQHNAQRADTGEKIHLMMELRLHVLTEQKLHYVRVNIKIKGRDNKSWEA